MTDSPERLRLWLSVAHASGVSPRVLTQVIEAFGSLQAASEASAAELSSAGGAALVAALRDEAGKAEAERGLRWLAEGEQRFILCREDEYYPPLLHEIADPPPVLYGIGRPELLCLPSLAIIGARNPTAQGQANAAAFAKSLTALGTVVVSGLAAGIDAAAHEGALDAGGTTVAVLGTGADRVYPAQHHHLAHRIADRGALVSEFPLGTPPLPGNFPRRNRIISGLSRGCLVVEAALASGSLITARHAVAQNREVFAVPGSIHSPLAKGCHALIKQGAKLVESIDDIVQELDWPAVSLPAAPLPAGASGGLLDVLGFDPCDIDTLCARSRSDAASVSAELLQLELAGLVEALPGGRYQRRH